MDLFISKQSSQRFHHCIRSDTQIPDAIGIHRKYDCFSCYGSNDRSLPIALSRSECHLQFGYRDGRQYECIGSETAYFSRAQVQSSEFQLESAENDRPDSSRRTEIEYCETNSATTSSTCSSRAIILSAQSRTRIIIEHSHRWFIWRRWLSLRSIDELHGSNVEIDFIEHRREQWSNVRTSIDNEEKQRFIDHRARY